MFVALIRKSYSKKIFAAQISRYMSSEVAQTNSVPNHKPKKEDITISGSYASALFTCASKAESLYAVFKELTYIEEVTKDAPGFKYISRFDGMIPKEKKALHQILSETLNLSELTSNFMEVVIDNNRLNELDEIIHKFKKMYVDINREEKMQIISADELSKSEKDEVLAALQQNERNIGKHFLLEFKVDKNIKGGLILYTENEFMDMSLSSRINKINQELKIL